MDNLGPSKLLNLCINRHDLLHKFREGITDKRELTAELDISRPTVDRAFRDLEECEIFVSDGTDYEMTLFGELVVEQVQTAMSSLEKLIVVRHMIKDLPRDIDIPTELFLAGDIHRSTPQAPSEPLRLISDSIAGSREFVMLLPVINPEYVRMLHEAITEQEKSGEIILPTETVEILFSNYRNELNDIIASVQCELYQTKRSISYDLVIVDESVLWASFYGPAGGLRGAIVNESDDVIN